MPISNQMEYQREVLAFDEKIALAELEEVKASERVKELKYQKHRFMLDFAVAALKAQQAAEEEAQQQQETQPQNAG
jgi:hypothetical protein